MKKSGYTIVVSIIMIIVLFSCNLLASAYSLHIITNSTSVDFIVSNGNRTIFVIGNTTINGLYGNITIVAISLNPGYYVKPSKLNISLLNNLTLYFYVYPISLNVTLKAIGPGTVIVKLPNGTVLNGSYLSFNIPYYSRLEITAKPYKGYTFYGWSNGISSRSQNVLILDNFSLTATFGTLKDNNGITSTARSSKGLTALIASFLLLIAMIILFRSTKGSNEAKM
ncbi:MAG: hypothetical protein OWQ54_08655 [Sulfolobaceae archaeon]|nr:hypothetical protein [Sulfolobaceae archaeon]